MTTPATETQHYDVHVHYRNRDNDEASYTLLQHLTPVDLHRFVTAAQRNEFVALPTANGGNHYIRSHRIAEFTVTPVNDLTSDYVPAGGDQ